MKDFKPYISYIFPLENSSGLAAQNTSWMLLPGHINPTMTTPPAYVSSTVTTNHIVPSQHSGRATVLN